MIVDDLFESPQTCPECGGPAFSDLLLAEKKDACYHKVRSRYKVWPSAYASGALVQCRKKGAANWGNKSKNEGVAEGWVDTIKNIFKRKPRDNRTVFEKDPEAQREFERSGGYEAGLDPMGWQIGWFAAENAQGDTMKQAFQKLYYGGGSPVPFDDRSFKLAWVAYNKHHGPQVAMEGPAFDKWANERAASQLHKLMAPEIKGKIQNIVSRLSDEYGMWDHKAQTFTPDGLEHLKSILKFNDNYIRYALSLTSRDFEAEGVAEEQLDEKCWDTHKQVGMKNKGGRMVPNCVPKEGVEETQHEKIGGRYDADEFDAMVGRLKKLAGAGPMKTVWDPVKRVYKNVPVAQQPQDKK